MSKKKEGGEDRSGGEVHQRAESSGRRRGGRDKPSGVKGGERRAKRTCTRVCVCIRAEGDSPHCDCYTHGRNVPPVCRLMPTRNQTRADSSYCSLSRPSNGATGCTTFHLPSCSPPAIHAVHIHKSRAAVYTLCTNSQPKERKRGKGELNHG